MTVRILLFIFAICVFSCTSEPTPPNFIIFIADDVSINDLGAYGNNAVQSPTIDSLARDGLLFHHMFLTTSSCSPSRASILTGRYPHNTGAPELHMPLPDSILTVAQQLKNQGYFTGASGKWHMGEYATKGFTKIFDSETGPGGEARWEEMVNEIPESTPYFLWMAAYDAHRNWGENPFNGSTDTLSIEAPPYIIRDSATVADLASYYDEITRFDHYIGETLKCLESRGMMKNTIVMIMADNGRPFPRDKTRLYDSGIKTPFILWASDNIQYPRGTETDALVSVIDIAPTLIQWSSGKIGATYQGISFQHLLSSPETEHREYVFAQHNWHDYTSHERMIRSKQFLLIENAFPERPMSGATDIHNSPTFKSLLSAYEKGTLDSAQLTHFIAPRPGIELYDCTRDPHQLKNLALHGEYQGVLDEYRDILDEWKDRTGDYVPSNPTADKYDYLTAQPYEPERHFADIDRGEVPGERTSARNIISSDSLYLLTQ